MFVVEPLPLPLAAEPDFEDGAEVIELEAEFPVFVGAEEPVFVADAWAEPTKRKALAWIRIY